ncbi:MAG TPA: VWA domain-containing protein, partial [Longimicrobiaceae bacterium]|nr:VWA domain-containing protein [Longimicrobiaceae bacterium]
EGRVGAAEVVLALDASNSMLAEDVPPNRLERERAAARALVRGLPGNRIGVVAFSARGYVLSPLTSDAGALELYLDALNPGIVTQGGSSLASALRQGAGLLLGADSARARRVLVLMTDGEALEEREEVLLAAEYADRVGVTVHTVGIGTAAGARVPDLDPVTGVRRGFKRDVDGTEVVSRLDEELLREVARETGGSYFALSEPGALERLRGELAGLPAAAGPERSGSGPALRYEWFVALALALLVLDTAMDARRRRRAHPLPAR